MLTLSIHIILYNIESAYSHAVLCTYSRTCARDTGDVIWQYMAVNSKRSVSVHMCVVFVAFNMLKPWKTQPLRYVIAMEDTTIEVCYGRHDH